jgi:hypothetical protein
VYDKPNRKKQSKSIVANPEHVEILMSNGELNIYFVNSSQYFISVKSEQSETLDFKSPVSKKDLQDLCWYIEVYGAQYTGEPDDEEAKRIEAKLITLGENLFNAIFTTDFIQALFQQFQQCGDRLLTIYSDVPEILVVSHCKTKR